jgi:hypothetical protein
MATLIDYAFRHHRPIVYKGMQGFVVALIEAGCVFHADNGTPYVLYFRDYVDTHAP